MFKGYRREWPSTKRETWWHFFPATKIYNNTDFFSLQIIAFSMCLWKRSPKLYSLSVNCQKSKEPNQWKVSLGEVFIPEASKKKTEHGNERSGSYGRTDDMRTPTCKEKASQVGVNSKLATLVPWRYLFYAEKYTSSLYCCLKQSSLFKTLQLLNNLVLFCPQSD